MSEDWGCAVTVRLHAGAACTSPEIGSKEQQFSTRQRQGEAVSKEQGAAGFGEDFLWAGRDLLVPL